MTKIKLGEIMCQMTILYQNAQVNQNMKVLFVFTDKKELFRRIESLSLKFA